MGVKSSQSREIFRLWYNIIDNMDKKEKFPSELRLDPVSKDWVIIAIGRAEKTPKEPKALVKSCVFCHLESQGKPLFVLPTLSVIPNKFPAVLTSKDLRKRNEGPYQMMDSVGFHEVVVTKDHIKDISQFSIQETREVIDAYQQRYLALMNQKFVNYISIFHNHGRQAGASLSHPHSQIIAIPVIDPDTQKTIIGSQQYWNLHKKCVYCEMLKWEQKDGRRIVFENDEFLVLCPFASRMAFEIRIYPKKHLSYFEKINEEQKTALAEALNVALRKIRKALNSPDYNFFLRTSPCDGKDYSHYHWHFEILPRTSTQAGFELGAGMEISTIEPEKAAECLRKK